MLEYPEIKTIVSQMQTELIGKTITSARMVHFTGNMFMKEEDIDKYAMLYGGTITHIECLPPDIYIALDNGYGILFCQSGGKILLNKSLPTKNHNIIFHFTDGTNLTYTIKRVAI